MDEPAPAHLPRTEPSLVEAITDAVRDSNGGLQESDMGFRRP